MLTGIRAVYGLRFTVYGNTVVGRRFQLPVSDLRKIIACRASSHTHTEFGCLTTVRDSSTGVGAGLAGDRVFSDFRLPTSDFRLPTSDVRLPTSDFRLPTSELSRRIQVLGGAVVESEPAGDAGAVGACGQHFVLDFLAHEQRQRPGARGDAGHFFLTAGFVQHQLAAVAFAPGRWRCS